VVFMLGACAQILEIQEALGRAKDADDARAGGAADPRRWTGLRTVVDARAMLKAVFQAAAQSRVQVRGQSGHD